MSASTKPLSPSPEVAVRIQRRIDELQPESLGAWPIRVCKEELNALPLHANMIYLWAMQPDGVVLCLDHEAFGHPVYPETDPLITFAVVVQGARQYPELQDLVPAPPPHTRLCKTCNGTGRLVEGEEANTPCLQCRALGWFCTGPANPPEPAA